MSVSVIMVSYHTGEVLFPAIARVLKQQNLAELVLVNNGNPPEALTRLQALARENPKFKLLTGHGNIGFARACNLGAKNASGDYILLLNPDCLLPENAFAPFMTALESHQAMLAGPKLLNADGTPQRGGKRQLLTPSIALSESLSLHRFTKLKRLNEHEAPLSEEVQEVPVISGACMFLRISDYHALGGLDEGYFLHVEDLDFCYRVNRAGGKTILVPEVEVVHLLSTSDAPSAFIEKHKAHGFIRYFRTHFAHDYPAWLLKLTEIGIWVRYALKQLTGYFPQRNSASAVRASRQLLVLEKFSAGNFCYPREGEDIMQLEIRTCAGMTKRRADATILITGATSQIGLCLVGRLLAKGATVYAISRKSLPFQHPNLHWVTGNLEENVNLPQADYLIHCAAIWLLPDALSAMAQAGVKRIIAFSSTSIFGKANSNDTHEQDIVKELERSEAALKHFSEGRGIGWTVLRPTLIYGLGLDANVTRILNSIKRFGFFPYFPPATGLRQPVHADDLAMAAMQALENEQALNKAYNLSGGETLTYRQMVSRIFEYAGRKPRLIPLPFMPLLFDIIGRLRHKAHINGEMARRMNENLVFSHEEAAKDFGYSPRGFLEEF